MTSSADPALDIVSAGAVKTLLACLARAFLDGGGAHARLTFDTAPAITRRLDDGERYDVLAVPAPLLSRLSQSGRVSVSRRVALARVGVGMVGRRGKDSADISTPAALTAALLEAEAIVINQASTGLYMERLLDRLGILEKVAEKVIRLPTGRAVMMRMADAPPNYIGFGATTEIEVHAQLGVCLAAMLPDALQNYTHYEAASCAGRPALAAADRFIAFIAAPGSTACYVASGLEPSSLAVER